ncbi:hypothetical protein ES703_17404 [subsurface metagenome]
MSRCRLTGPGAPVDGLETHYPHQPPDTFPVDPVALTLQPRGYLACPVEWCGQVLTVNQLHKSQILLRDSFRLAVKA